MKYIQLFRKHGLKLTHIAKKMGMSESLLRYHLSQKEVDSSIEAKLLKILSKNTEDLKKSLGERI